MRFYVLTGIHMDDLGVGGQGQSEVSKNVQRQRSARLLNRVSNSKEALLRWQSEQEDGYRWTPIRKWKPGKGKRKMSKRKYAARLKSGFLS